MEDNLHDGMLGSKATWRHSEDDLTPSPALTDHSDHNESDESAGSSPDYSAHNG